MKSRFQSHFPLSPDRIGKLWREAIFVFDTNTILNFYRYSDQSRTEFIETLQQLRARIWLPEQSAHEFFSNRLSELASHEKVYTDAEAKIASLRDAFDRDKGHPFISRSLLEKANPIFDEIVVELRKRKDEQSSRLNNDDILEAISKVFDGRVGEGMSTAELEATFIEGEKRYKNKVPPGYKDAGKYQNPETMAQKRSVYGDLIVWKQTLELSKSQKKSVIFVTDDRKEDWWVEINGRLISPRTELIDEFTEFTGMSLLVYRSDQFLKYARDELNSKVSNETIEEIKSVDVTRPILSVEVARSISDSLRQLRSNGTRRSVVLHPQKSQNSPDIDDVLRSIRKLVGGDANRTSVRPELDTASAELIALKNLEYRLEGRLTEVLISIDEFHGMPELADKVTELELERASLMEELNHVNSLIRRLGQ